MSITPTEEVTTPTEEVPIPTDKKSSKGALITGAVILGLLILAAGTGAIVYYAVKKKDDDDVSVLVIDQETAILSYDTYWPECQGQIFVNEKAKELYSIDVRIYDKYTYGVMHVELYNGLIGSGNLIAKSSSKIGQGWTSFDFPTHPILSTPDYVYTFVIVPDNGQDVAVYYNDGANLGQGKRIIYNFTTKEETDGPAGSSLTFKLFATT